MINEEISEKRRQLNEEIKHYLARNLVSSQFIGSTRIGPIRKISSPPQHCNERRHAMLKLQDMGMWESEFSCHNDISHDVQVWCLFIHMQIHSVALSGKCSVQPQTPYRVVREH